MILYLNTTNLRNIEFKLLREKHVIATYSAALAYEETSDILMHLEKFLKKNNISAKKQQDKTKVTTILLHTGPGSNSGLRIGSAIAQAISFAWAIEYKTTKRAI
jgi:tRNA A37 threonylcarbamoyladenosine modification protein TsaB